MKKLILFLVIVLLAGCTRAAPERQPYALPAKPTSPAGLTSASGRPTRTVFVTPSRLPGGPVFTPTPDAPHPVPTVRTDPIKYTIKAGDTLGKIAQANNISLEELEAANQITNPDRIDVGLVLTIPVSTPEVPASSFKIIPDSELVYGPSTVDFNIASFIEARKGFLSHYSEDVDNETVTGAEVVSRVAREFSVNPRLLLAVLEYRSAWVTASSPDQATHDYPLAFPDLRRVGLYKQLSWAADNLNRGFYLWKVNAIPNWVLADGTLVLAAATVNAGTAGVQNLMALFYGKDSWSQAVSADGFYTAYQKLFGYPFDLTYEPLVPAGTEQPPLQLPFESGVPWSFTGGPHGGYGDGSGWAALDFAPPGENQTCPISTAWAVAAAPGVVIRSEHGEVVLDLDGDGLEQTGWTLLYLHVDKQDRVAAGRVLKAGDTIGHPSCEGGVSTATHLHLARRYNGEWIPADGPLPYNLDGWVSQGNGIVYDGYLNRNGETVEAWDGRATTNEIRR